MLVRKRGGFSGTRFVLTNPNGYGSNNIMKKEIVLYGFLNIVYIYSTYPGPDVNEGKP